VWDRWGVHILVLWWLLFGGEVCISCFGTGRRCRCALWWVVVGVVGLSGGRCVFWVGSVVRLDFVGGVRDFFWSGVFGGFGRRLEWCVVWRHGWWMGDGVAEYVGWGCVCGLFVGMVWFVGVLLLLGEVCCMFGGFVFGVVWGWVRVVWCWGWGIGRLYFGFRCGVGEVVLRLGWCVGWGVGSFVVGGLG